VIVTALNRIALPAFANLRGDPARMTQSFLRALSFTSTITAPIFAGLIVVSSDAIAVTMGPTWAEAAPILSLIAATAYLTTIGQYNQSILLVHDKPHWQTILTGIYAVSNIALFMVVVRYGLTALAIGYTARAILLYPLSAGSALYLLKIKATSYVVRLLPSIAAATVMAVATLAFRSLVGIEDALPRLAASIAVGIVSYVMALAAFGLADLKDFYRFMRKVLNGR